MLTVDRRSRRSSTPTRGAPRVVLRAPADPVASRRCSEHAPRHRARGRVDRRGAGAIGLRERRRLADRWPPDRLRGLAPRRGRADDPRLLPLRRPAGRPDRPVGDGAVRAVRARTAASSGAAPPTTRASCTCTSRPPRRSSRRAGSCRSTCKFLFEGEEEHSSAGLDELARGQPGPPRGRRRRDQRHRLLRGQRPGDHDVAARHGLRPDRRDRRRRSTSTRAASAAPSRTRPTRSRGSSPSSSTTTAASACPASTTTSCRRRARSGSRSAACRSTRATSTRSTGVPELVAGEPGFSLLECSGVRPTLDVNGIWGGFTGEG